MGHVGGYAGRALSRRDALRMSLGLALASLPLAGARAASGVGIRRLKFANLHTGERLRATFWEDGRYIDSELKSIDWLLRDFRTDEAIAIDSRLLNQLYLLQQRLESRGWVRVISGYRSPRTNAMLAANSAGVAKKSLHIKGMAIDLSLSDRDLADVRRAALSLRAGGVGYYPKPGFVHLDTGRVRFW